MSEAETTAPPTPPLRASIAKFASLTQSDVQEQIETTWSEWLEHLAAEPTGSFGGSLDHGGWSPVIYDPPRRAKDNVKLASALVLDHDKSGDWDRVFKLWCDSYGLLYTTKSHGAPNTTGHRLRAVLPLARPVSAEEYAKLWEWASKRSSEAGCPVDPQAKDVSRFWYDPSMPPGGWRSELLAGEPINPDPVLALAEQPRLRVVRPPELPTQGLRLDRARKYVSRIPGAVAGQAGHTATFNAVAHVMYGFDLDPDDTMRVIADDYNPRCQPPWSEKELLHKIRSVAEKCNRERGYLLNERPRISTPQQAAAAAPQISQEVTRDWRSELLVKKDRTPKRAYHNTLLFVRCHEHYRGKWALDTMTNTPWFDDEPMRETMVHEIRAHADVVLGYTPGRDDVEAAILQSAQDRPFHPILQYLRSLDWDGTPRLDTMARDYLGSESPMHATMLRKFMIGAAARVLWPGCKLDTALMLVGDQGRRKSSFFSVLGGQWHADSFVDITNKDSFVQIHGAWIYELAELENVVTGRAESRLKAWLTSTHDTYRAPYQRTAQRKARAVIICGTTNRRQFLTDTSGSRRFWIIPVDGDIPVDLLSQMRDQLWAEAVCAAEAQEHWWLDAASDREREAVNVDYRETDSWAERIADFLASPGITETTVTEILEDGLKLEIGRHDRWSQMRVAQALADLGWLKTRSNKPPRHWKYIRPGTQEDLYAH